MSLSLGTISDFLRISLDRLRYIHYRKKYDISPSFRFSGVDIQFVGDGEISCGEQSYIGSYGEIYSDSNMRVVIGRGSAISHNVRIFTVTWEADQDFGLSHKRMKRGNVIIGNNCWIGTNVYIDCGITIGENAVIGANSVVSRDIPPHCIAVGIPAKVIKIKSYVSDEEKREIIAKYWSSLNTELQRQHRLPGRN